VTSTEELLVRSAMRAWDAQIGRAARLFASLNDEESLREIAPGRNRLVYIWGHLTASNDDMFPLLGLGSRRHPELDPLFIEQPDRAVALLPSAAELRQCWDDVHSHLEQAFVSLSPADWVQRHTRVDPSGFAENPLRNRFSVLIHRTEHVAYHLGQGVIGRPR
jgi:hypothetical protein